MSKPGKIITTIVILAIVVLVGLSIMVNIFLSEDKLKAVIIPQAEKTLGRKVEIKAISVSLFSGITVKDMVIKEADQQSDFAGIKEFVLRYELLPLLSKQIVIKEILFREPQIVIHRDKNGNFNFSSLAMLAAAATDKPETAAAPAPPAETGTGNLPLALTVDRITIKQARLTVTDELGELPEINGVTDAGIGVNLAGGLASLQLNGDLDFNIDVVYQQLKPHIQGTVHFDRQQISFNVDADLDNEKVQLSGSAADYLTTPDIKLDITSKKLDIDHLLGLLAGLAQPVAPADPKKPESAAPGDKAPAKALAAGLPPGLKAQGKIAVDQSIYKGLAVNNLLLRYSLVAGILDLTDIGADIADGRLAAKMRIDLNKSEPAFNGEFLMDKVRVEQLVAGLTETDFNELSGALHTSLTFKGSGLDWPRISKTLLANGDYGLLDGKIRETPISRTVADLLKLDDLRKFSFAKLTGNLEIKDGRVLLKSAMNSKDITAQSRGSIGLDGTMNLPLSLKLSPELSKKLQKNLSIAKYLRSENGETELNFKIGGTVEHPRAVLDEVAVENVIIDIGGRELDRFLSKDKDKDDDKAAQESDKPEDAGRQLLRNLLGK